MATGHSTFPIPALKRHRVGASAAAATTSSKTSRFYRPELDVLRFFAFFSVFIAHGVDVDARAGILHHHPAVARAVIFLHHAGGFGLSLFFFLSSFLITTLLMLERDKTGTVNLQSFYMRRMLRIWPLYFFYMGAAFFLGQAWAPAHFSLHALIAYFSLSANWYVIATGTLTPAVMFLWSISVEEQFYLVWPAVVRSLTIRGIRNFCLVLLAASLVGTFALAATGSSVVNVWFNSVVESLFFAGGGLFALQIGLKQQSKSWLRCVLGAVVCIVCWLVADALTNMPKLEDPIPPVHAVSAYILILVGVGSLLWAFLHMPQRLLISPLVYLGRISYGLYVFHGMTILIGRSILAHRLPHGVWLWGSLALTIALAVTSYEFFEKPFLKLKHRFELVHSRSA